MGIRCDTINIKSTQFDVSVSELQNSFGFVEDFLQEHPKSVFLTLEIFMTETTCT